MKFLHFVSCVWVPCGVAVSVYVVAVRTPLTRYTPSALSSGSVTVAAQVALLYA